MPAVAERAGVAGVVQDPQHGVVSRRPPVQLPFAGPNEPMSALAPTYGFRRALNPPANAAAPFRNWPRRRETPRAAPCSVRAPRVQSTPSSPSTLFARKLYAGVTAMAKPGWPSVPCTRQRPYTSVSLVDCAPLARPTIDLVANRAPRSS